MRPFSAREVAAALLKKGFVEREGDHRRFHFLHEGKDVGVSTKISHGARAIGIGLVKRMRGQMCLGKNADFQRFVECPLTIEEYVETLKKRGTIPSPP